MHRQRASCWPLAGVVQMGLNVVRPAVALAGICLTTCGYDDNRNPPPLNNLEGYPSRGGVTSPPAPTAVDVDKPDIRAHLRPIAPAEVDIRATLKQVDRSVLIALTVEGGPPGQARVAVDERSCDTLASSVLSNTSRGNAGTSDSQIGLGRLTVNDMGAGELVTSIEGAMLQRPERADSLTGKSLVVYHSGHETDAQRDIPIACTKI